MYTQIQPPRNDDSPASLNGYPRGVVDGGNGKGSVSILVSERSLMWQLTNRGIYKDYHPRQTAR